MLLPYTSIDMLRAMQREWFADDRNATDPDATDRRSPGRREPSPDPLGLALMRLLSLEAPRVSRMPPVRLGRLWPRRAA